MGQARPLYTLDEAVRRALAARTNRYDYCLQTVQEWYGVDRHEGSAYDAWAGSRYKHPGDWHPPRGAPVFWRDRVGGGAGHVALVVEETPGQVMIRSTDAAAKGRPATVPLDWPDRNWPLDYVGWTTDLEGVVIPELVARHHSHHQHQHVTPNPPHPPHPVPAWPGHPLGLGASGEAVRTWQQAMRARGFTLLNADGSYGPQSETSCRWLQAYLRQVPTGEVDENVWNATWSES